MHGPFEMEHRQFLTAWCGCWNQSLVLCRSSNTLNHWMISLALPPNKHILMDFLKLNLKIFIYAKLRVSTREKTDQELCTASLSPSQTVIT